MRCFIFLVLMVWAMPADAEVWINPAFAPAGIRYAAAPAPVSRAPVPVRQVDAVVTPVAQVSVEEVSQPILTGAKWSGRVNFGASLQTGNTEKDALLADAEVKAKFNETQRMRLRADYNREKDDGTVTEDNRSIDGVYDHFFKPKWFYNVSAGLEQDDIADLDLRTTLGAGLGYEPYTRDDLNLQMALGPTYLRESFENDATDSSLAARWALDYDQKVLEERFQIFHNHEIFVPSDDTGAFLFESKTGARIPITKGIVATGEIDFDWDNDPAIGVVEDDTKYAVKLGYEW